jgi:hypothetical protein
MDLQGIAQVSLSTPSLDVMAATHLKRRWSAIAVSEDLTSISIHLRSDIPGRYYVNTRLLGRLMPCMSDPEIMGAVSFVNIFLLI